MIYTEPNEDGRSATIYITYSLAMRVMAVAILNFKVGDWSAYVNAVPGMNHRNEWREVAKHGDRLPRKAAEALFGDDLAWLSEKRPEKTDDDPFSGPYRWRD